ncbi:FAD-dependent oxidoreductase [Fulvivirgaceae bacterium BMA12]|uniref:FAD-dependent oxidoreductase n=1 Tax=Agaribacillus aureus TaxID=3051825 RepID=A0ABT8L8Q6_9BACT|nr:FAD-dependent oxidoreductase [Fulvivirgaceae bacterium BMA12]
MLRYSNNGARTSKLEKLKTDLVVIGGGIAGVCCAITAARKGIKVVLVQDRPVLGGNASSEVRLWILGATSHMGNNNRWAREGGVIDELLVENMYRNPDGNTLIFDTILLEKVWQEDNLTLLLNTAVYNTIKSEANRIAGINAFCSQNSMEYEITASLFCDASGDGIVAFQSGAAFRMGAESSDEFDEAFAPTKDYGELLGHTMYFMTKDVGKPVAFTPPAYALNDITKIPRYKQFSTQEHGCQLWWIEYGGRLDTVHETETIKWELWKVIYGVWDYIKNSGKFPEANTMTLEWVGQIPGKRESRRFEGHFTITQADIVEQRHFDDTVSFGGWAIDLHPADGIFSEKPGCNQWHSKGIYEIPYRSMIVKGIDNLFLAGRILSSSHVAFGSTRVMATSGHNGQAVGMAAALTIKNNCLPADLLVPDRMKVLQQALLKTGQYIPHLAYHDNEDLLNQHCTILAKDHLVLSEIPFDGELQPLEYNSAQLLPISGGPVPTFEIAINALEDTELVVSLRKSSKSFNYTPDVTLASKTYAVKKGKQHLTLHFDASLETNCYVFLCFHQNQKILIQTSQTRISGIVSVFNKQNKAVSNFGRQDPDPALGFESFEFWIPVRRPQGPNFAIKIDPPLDCFGESNLTNGFFRPYLKPNAWVADLQSETSEIIVKWHEVQQIRKITLSFDTDWDHPMESSLLTHEEHIMPFVINNYEVLDKDDQVIHIRSDNYQTRNEITLENTIISDTLKFRFQQPSKKVPIALFGLNIYK